MKNNQFKTFDNIVTQLSFSYDSAKSGTQSRVMAVSLLLDNYEVTSGADISGAVSAIETHETFVKKFLHEDRPKMKRVISFSDAPDEYQQAHPESDLPKFLCQAISALDYDRVSKSYDFYQDKQVRESFVT